jgi:hypothetical protein
LIAGPYFDKRKVTDLREVQGEDGEWEGVREHNPERNEGHGVHTRRGQIRL